MVNDDRSVVCSFLAKGFGRAVGLCEAAYDSAPRNVRTTLARQIKNASQHSPDRPVSSFRGELAFLEALGRLPLEYSIFTLARLYEEAHVYLCRTIDRARKGKPHNAAFLRKRSVGLEALTDELVSKGSVAEQRIYLEEQQICLESDENHPDQLQASWRQVAPMNFDHLPVLESLADILPGETTPSSEYAGIGGGGGSDVISTSIIGLLLRRHRKEMNLLISTRTWAIGSQGKAGGKVGIKREVYEHGGQVHDLNGNSIPGTFRVGRNTHAEGRDLEAIPFNNHSQIYMVLDQGESRSNIPVKDQANLPDQFKAILSQSKRQIQTVVTIDTGGDVFGIDLDCKTTATPDQDFRVQQAISTLSPEYQRVTCVVAPGVDAPSFAPDMAKKAGGVVYHPSQAEKAFLLNLLVKEYKMDGSEPNRFGKTSLALQARLKGKTGWVSLDLPEYVVNTWENPWNSFVYVRKCIEDLVFMPTVALVHELNHQLATNGESRGSGENGENKMNGELRENGEITENGSHVPTSSPAVPQGGTPDNPRAQFLWSVGTHIDS